MIAATAKIRTNTTEPTAPRRLPGSFVPRVMTLGGRSSVRARLAGLSSRVHRADVGDASRPALPGLATL